MKIIAKLIKTKVPNYACFASCAFDVPYNHLWNEQKYFNWSKSKGCEFNRLKKQYSALPLTRTMIINLFRQGNYYDGFLCAMVWGNIGANPNGKTIFQYIFNMNNQSTIITSIQGVVQLLQNNNLPAAYNALNNGALKIKWLGESFSTKLLYFAGANISNINPQPLIFDSNMHIVYDKIIKIFGAKAKRGAVNKYIDYCEKMEQLSKLLNLQSAGHLEAFLFCPGFRAIIF